MKIPSTVVCARTKHEIKAEAPKMIKTRCYRRQKADRVIKLQASSYRAHTHIPSEFNRKYKIEREKRAGIKKQPTKKKTKQKHNNNKAKMACNHDAQRLS